MKSYKQLMASDRGRIRFLYGSRPLTNMHMINSKWIQKDGCVHIYIHIYVCMYAIIEEGIMNVRGGGEDMAWVGGKRNNVNSAPMYKILKLLNWFYFTEILLCWDYSSDCSINALTTVGSTVYWWHILVSLLVEVAYHITFNLSVITGGGGGAHL